MKDLPQAVHLAVDSFKKLPGVGDRTALRYTMAMLKWGDEQVSEVAKNINALREVKKCEDCGFFSEVSPCSICSSEERKSEGVICVVENISDLMAIETGNVYKGHYHVLGGVINPLSGIGPNELRVTDLCRRIEEGDYQEIILAINPSVEGDATCSYLADLFKEKLKVHRIGFGVPIGGALEYLDPLTISKAIENRSIL